jgi:hypothetical protein
LRDQGAWYHIVVAFDSTQVTDTDRIKFYINGVQETVFTNTDYPSSGQNIRINESSAPIFIGQAGASASYFSGEMSHVQFVDGLQLAPTEFGEVDSTSGIWKIKTSAYATPGTNGFFLKMEDRTNLDLDSSSNAHTFTTSGTLTPTYDNPSNNFATMNPLDNYYPDATFSNGNNTIVTVSNKYAPTTSTLGMSAGKWYWEVKPTTMPNDELLPGIISTQPVAVGDEVGDYPNDYGYYAYNGDKVTDSVQTTYGDTFSNNDIISVALDLDNLKIYWAKNGTWQDSGDPTSGATGTGAAFTVTAPALTDLGTYFMAVTHWHSTVCTWNANFGNGYFGTTAVTSAEADGDGIGAFEYAPPTGYFTLCTKNIKAYGG